MEVCADSAEDAAARMERLLQLDLAALSEVEIALDDVFDVFDGLLQRKTVQVASGIKQDAAMAPAVTTILTAQDLEATGARTLTEALEAVPGLHVARNFFFNRPVFIMRGIYSEFNPQVLIMINNLPLKDVHSGNPTVRGLNIPVYKIQRVEIMRGPGSAVHGADALAGIINIITKTHQDIDGSEVGMRVGGFGETDAWALHSGRWAGNDFALMLRYGTEDGHEEIILEDHQTFHDRNFGTHVSHAPGPMELQRDNLDVRVDVSRRTQDEATWRLQLSNQYVFNAGAGAGPGQAIDRSGNGATRITDAVLSWQQPTLTEYWSAQAQLAYTNRSWTYSDIEVYPPGAFGGRFPAGFKAEAANYEDDIRLDLSGVYQGFAQHKLRLGSGYLLIDQYKVTQSINWQTPDRMVDISDTPAIYQPEEMRESFYFFVQDAWRFRDNWELTFGARYDNYSDFGSTVNWRGALVWQVRPDFTAKLLYGEAFRAPSFQELYNFNTPIANGNPDLDAETIKTLEWAFDYRLHDKLHLGLNLYRFIWFDAIEFLSVDTAQGAEGTSATRIAQNFAEDIKAYGAEFELRWKTSSRSSLLFNYAWQRVEQQIIGQDVQDWGNYPQHDAYIRGDWMLRPNWYLNMQANWIGHRHRAAGDPRDDLDTYATIDSTLRYKNIRGGRWNLAFGIKNILDEVGYEPSPGPDLDGVVRLPYDIPLAGRSWFFEARYRF